MDNKVKIHIVGAGVSGLVAARVLEEKGFFPVIIEATDRVGGRVKTDRFRDFQLDHGFQVLLTAYPAAQKYLDYGAWTYNASCQEQPFSNSKNNELSEILSGT